ncbi:hypothetical protein SASPL_133585 [Salvia splendens]|uniref:Uncharacterized protein n=1 Tax=Salvia splendens TaxID=180675 RepID=A0A8X8ZJ95_SALSN|nr:hypothetical protein SASPL_133585 [Salvia splendens]
MTSSGCRKLSSKQRLFRQKGDSLGATPRRQRREHRLCMPDGGGAAWLSEQRGSHGGGDGWSAGVDEQPCCRVCKAISRGKAKASQRAKLGCYAALFKLSIILYLDIHHDQPCQGSHLIPASTTHLRMDGSARPKQKLPRQPNEGLPTHEWSKNLRYHNPSSVWLFSRMAYMALSVAEFNMWTYLSLS